MSSPPTPFVNTPNYVTSKYLAFRLKLDEPLPEFEGFARDGNLEMSRALLKAGGDIQEGSAIFPQVRRCASNYSLYLYFQSIFQHDQSGQYMRLYQDSLKTLLQSLKYTPTERSEVLIEVSDNQSERQIPFSQVHYAGSAEALYS